MIHIAFIGSLSRYCDFICSFLATCNMDALYKCGGSGSPDIISLSAFSARCTSTGFVHNSSPMNFLKGFLRYRLPHFPVPLSILHFKSTSCAYSLSIIHCKVLPHLQVPKEKKTVPFMIIVPLNPSLSHLFFRTRLSHWVH